MYLIGDPRIFAIGYEFFDDSRDTEISLYVDGNNILAFERNGELLTTRWNLDELTNWLRDFVARMEEDPYPVDCEGRYAAQKDDSARDFDSENIEIFDAYYQQLDDWNLRHRWHPASSGAILADVYFQRTGDLVEVSWDNRDLEDGVRFHSLRGGSGIPEALFSSVIHTFLREYAHHWQKSDPDN